MEQGTVTLGGLNPPTNIRVESVGKSFITLTWDKPASSGITYHVVCNHDNKTVQEQETDTNTVTFNDLRPGVQYSFQIESVNETRCRSKTAQTSARTLTHLKRWRRVLRRLQHYSNQLTFKKPRKTKPSGSADKSELEPETAASGVNHLESCLQDLGLLQFYNHKLTLSTVLQINKSTVTDDPAQSPSALPWLFLKKLMMANVTARSVECSPSTDDNGDSSTSNIDFDLDHLVLNQDPHRINPLDIITTLFLCSDSFLQQELALKMSMCQFSVPLLLPHCDTQQCTLMLWALRDIVKKFRPHSLSNPKGFVEERIVQYDLPLVSFVRLGDCSISKSHTLNNLLSNPQQYHDTFVHHNMECGDVSRKISDGLVEISWYLPCGTENIDIFPDPVAFTNLRGDIRKFETQYSFLCQVSTAVFVFCDDLDSNYQLLTSKNGKAELFLVSNAQTKSFNMNVLKRLASKINLKTSNIILKTKSNEADFVKKLSSSVRDVVKNSTVSVQLEKMTEVAHELGISIDEHKEECQTAKQNAEKITCMIEDTMKFKEQQLPLQGETWKKLAKLEKELCRLRSAGDKPIEDYKSELLEQMNDLRKQQSSYNISDAMVCFISALSSSSLERSYFLKWMRMNLDRLSCEKLSGLRELYKEKCQESSENKEEIARLDKQISNSALGTEHFLREIGQLYEAAVSLPETSPSHQQMLHLPKLCAQLLLDGFPLELVDGDASNIPTRWISDVLKELNTVMEDQNKIRVVTVLGVQSTGKSTLLNTMFGVQFAVSSGRCTRGAFMLLIKITGSFKEEINCDYLMIIDTEGLKSPELSQLDDSYEHDNELATLVVGLSDITIINIAMENCTEMKDILQIVVHAFIRMKEVGRRTKCVFVHQNVADVSAHDKNTRDRKLLLEQLNEMTEAAARMEHKEEYKKFTDVIEYDPDTGNWYIPGLWHGNPPMAPLNTGYSEAVYDFKKNMMDILVKQKNKMSAHTVPEFLEWTTSLWKSVKYENFIFSFRNSLVADAYIKLCTEFSKWEWSFKKCMYKLLTDAETKVSNYGMMNQKCEKSDLEDLLSSLKDKASSELDGQEKIMKENLNKYFEQTDGHVNLVEKYREDFESSVNVLRIKMENSIMSKLEEVIEIRTAKLKLDNIKKTYMDTMERKVLNLLTEIRNKTSLESMSEEELDKSFEKMWQETLKEFKFEQLKKQNISDLVFKQLRENMKQKGSSVSERLSEVRLNEHSIQKFKVTDQHLCTFQYLFGIVIDLFHIKSEHKQHLQDLADSIIAACSQLVLANSMGKSDYHDNYIQEVLNEIDAKLEACRKLKFSEEFELSLKLHICAISAREFQSMHDQFIEENDPHRCLERNKDQYCADFKDLFHDRDQCKRKAEEFTKFCLRPAVETFICDKLGPDLVDEMLRGDTATQFSTRGFFQYSILQHLLKEEKFKDYLDHIESYEDFVKWWLLRQITSKFSNGHKLTQIEESILRRAVQEIKEAIRESQKCVQEKENIKQFIQNICRELASILIIPTDALEAVMALNNASEEQFANWLTQSMEEMEESLKSKFNEENIKSKLNKVKIKPQDELFKRVFGCGKQCPFCKVPCEAGGEGHSKHCASVHRPRGLGRRRWEVSEKLVTDICSTAVQSELRFNCHETNNEYHPYKEYREIFPDWDIPPDSSIEASDYWKYVMVKFNNQFAEVYKAKPADIPSAWRSITKEQAEKSLKKSFRIN